MNQAEIHDCRFCGDLSRSHLNIENIFYCKGCLIKAIDLYTLEKSIYICPNSDPNCPCTACSGKKYKVLPFSICYPKSI